MSVISSPREKSLSTATDFMIGQNLWKKILIGMALGVLAGLALSPESMALLPAETAYNLGEWIRLPGVLFLGLIQMVIVPLVVCSIILGIAENGSVDNVRRLGLRIVPYFIMTTAIAITIGLFMVNIIKPGMAIDPEFARTVIAADSAENTTPARTFDDLTVPERIANMIPTNFAQASLERNMLQIVIAAILVGIALLTVTPKSGRPFRDLCISGQVLSMKIISWAMIIAPYAVFGLICSITIRIGFGALVSVGYYMLTVLAALVIMLGVYLLIVKFIAGQSLKSFIAGIREVQILAFSTSSSAAAMPFSIQAAEEKLNIKPEISRFVIPLGTTINMDGTALYQAVAAIFLCQVFGIELSFAAMLLLLMTTVGASIGTPATPGVGIVILATILVGIGVPVEGIALIIGVDRILDMCRTTINVTGDLTAASVMQRWGGVK